MTGEQVRLFIVETAGTEDNVLLEVSLIWVATFTTGDSCFMSSLNGLRQNPSSVLWFFNYFFSFSCYLYMLKEALISFWQNRLNINGSPVNNQDHVSWTAVSTYPLKMRWGYGPGDLVVLNRSDPTELFSYFPSLNLLSRHFLFLSPFFTQDFLQRIKILRMDYNWKFYLD